MLVGVYTGGTPNLVSLKVALGVDPNLFVMTSTYDMIVGAIIIIVFHNGRSHEFSGLYCFQFRHNGESGSNR